MEPDDKDYFYAVGAERKGPVKITALKDLAIEGQLKRSDKVWAKGMDGWKPAGEVIGLFEELPPDLDEPIDSSAIDLKPTDQPPDGLVDSTHPMKQRTDLRPKNEEAEEKAPESGLGLPADRFRSRKPVIIGAIVLVILVLGFGIHRANRKAEVENLRAQIYELLLSSIRSIVAMPSDIPAGQVPRSAAPAETSRVRYDPDIISQLQKASDLCGLRDDLLKELGRKTGVGSLNSDLEVIGVSVALSNVARFMSAVVAAENESDERGDATVMLLGNLAALFKHMNVVCKKLGIESPVSETDWERCLVHITEKSNPPMLFIYRDKNPEAGKTRIRFTER